MLRYILKKGGQLGAVALFGGAVVLSHPATAANLWEGEKSHTVGGYPFISKLFVVDSAAPTVVFTPGRSSTARLGYGGHKGGLDKDFLAYWVTQNGYNFLGVSYPVLTESGAFDAAHPDFTVRAWGQGTAQVTKDVMEEAGLTGPIIHAGWSMSGKNAQAFAEAGHALGLDQEFFVSIAASPPVAGILGMNNTANLSEHGLAPLPPGAKPAVKQLSASDKANGRVVIPAEILATQYLGQTPIGLMARGLRYDAESKSAVQDHWADMQDTKFYDFDSFPLVATVIPGQGDPRHALTDVGMWALYNTNKIYAMAGKDEGLRAMDPAKFDELVELTLNAPRELSVRLGGNHFFFVGEAGAKATADAIQELDLRIEKLGTQIDGLIAAD